MNYVLLEASKLINDNCNIGSVLYFKTTKTFQPSCSEVLIEFYIFIENRRLAWDEAQINENESVSGNNNLLKDFKAVTLTIIFKKSKSKAK